MSTPTSITFVLGKDEHGREIHLIRDRNEHGVVCWTLLRHPYNQRDDLARIDKIPEEVMRRLVNSVGDPKGAV